MNKRQQDRAVIDKMVDYRKQFKPFDLGPIRVNLEAREMHEALGQMNPNNNGRWPALCLYRGYYVIASKTEKEILAKHPERPPPIVVARRSDPETSHAAAAEVTAKDTAQRSVKAVVTLLRAAGEPLNDFQIHSLWPEVWDGPFSESLPRKARHWAREAGEVMHAGFGQHQGRRVRVWTVGRDGEFLKENR
jgi:hypothetical protein